MGSNLLYRGTVYRLQRGFWRGPDGDVVHLLTWVTDDLTRRGEIAPGSQDDGEVTRRVAAELGDAASLEDGPRGAQ